MLEILQKLDWTLKEKPSQQVKPKVKCGYPIQGEDSRNSKKHYRKNIKVNMLCPD